MPLTSQEPTLFTAAVNALCVAEMRRVSVPVIDLPASPVRAGRGLVDSVRAFGVLSPVIIQRVAEVGPFRTIAGKRRIAAAKELGIDFLDAWIVPTGLPDADALTLVENWTRTDNQAAEMEAVLALLGTHSEDSIAAALRVPKKRIAQLLKLANMAPGIREGFAAGHITPSVANATSKLPREFQTTLAAKFAESGKLTVADVRDARLAKSQRAIDGLPSELFEAPPARQAAMPAGVPDTSYLVETLTRKLMKVVELAILEGSLVCAGGNGKTYSVAEISQASNETVAAIEGFLGALMPAIGAAPAVAETVT